MKFVFITLVTIVALAAIAQTIVSKSTAKTKTIEYKTLAQKNGFEIREYPENIPYIYAYTISQEEF